MLKAKVLESIRGVLDEWLLGFNAQNDFSINIFSSEKINLKNAIINPSRVNQDLAKAKAPIRLKAGMIGKVSVKTNLLNLFSESVNIELSDIHIILGPAREHLSQDRDFAQDLERCFYDLDN